MSEQRTEQPTKRKLEKARKEGRFPVSKELVSSMQFLVFVAIVGSFMATFWRGISALTRTLFIAAFHLEVRPAAIPVIYKTILSGVFTPMLSTAAILMGAILVAQLASTRLGISASKLSPQLNRLNPMTNVMEMPKRNMGALMQALILLPVLSYTVYNIIGDALPRLQTMPLASIEPGTRRLAGALQQLLWRTAFVLVLIGFVDFFRAQRRHGQSLKMTKQEIKQEHKESEGNPEIKQRIRQLQRSAARKQMMKAVPTATAVIVNPTHFSVAIRYDVDSMAAPRVVAKGKNYLAKRIRDIAVEHQVPIVENQPLAQALYKSTEVGQEIPADLYKAIAEILAYIFKLMNQRRP